MEKKNTSSKQGKSVRNSTRLMMNNGVNSLKVAGSANRTTKVRFELLFSFECKLYYLNVHEYYFNLSFQIFYMNALNKYVQR